MPTGIQNWSKTAATNATADSSIVWSEGQAPSTVNDSARGMMARVAEWRDDISGTITTGGSSTAYTVTTNRVFATAAVMSGSLICFIPHTTSGAAPTLAVDGLTARAINYATGVAVATGALKSGTPYLVTYIHASTEFIIVGALAVNGAAISVTSIDITGGTALTAPAVGDELAIYDLSVTANRKITLANFFKTIDALTAEATPATDDQIPLYDTSAGTADKVSLSVLAASESFKAMTKQYLTSGTAATYTTATGAKTIIVKMIGAGGGGGAVTTNAGATGGTTIFNSIEAIGGGGGDTAARGGIGGTGGAGSASLKLPGSAGGSGSSTGGGSGVISSGGHGAPGLFGTGAGRAGPNAGGAGVAAGANTGAGGGGAAGGLNASAGGGGGGGEYVEIIIAAPSATYTYTIGAAGAGGAAGVSAGGNGGTGIIIVEEYY